MDKFWEVRNSSTNNSIGELLILGDITNFEFFEDDVTVNTIKDDLEELGDIDKLKIKLNSNGGSVTVGLTISSLIQEYVEENDVEVECIILGIAASIASVIACSFDHLSLYPSSMLFIHQPWISIEGNADDLRKTADDLDDIAEALLNTYEKKSNLSRDEIRDLMTEETFLTAEECKLYGFADEIKEGDIAASIQGDKLVINGVEFDKDKIKKIPDNLEEFNNSINNAPRSNPRDPVYDGTEEVDWGDIDKTLEAYIEAYYEFSDADEPDEIPSEVTELPQAAKNWIANKTILGNATADNSQDLISLPVVSPETNNLNKNGLEAAKRLVNQMDDISEDTIEAAKNKCDQLLEEEFDEDEEQTDNKKEGSYQNMFKQFESKEDFEKYLNDNNYKKANSILNSLEDKIGLEFNSVEDVVDAFANVKNDLDEKEEEIQNLKADNLFAERKQKLEAVGVEVEDEDKEEIVDMSDKAFEMLVKSNKEKIEAIESKNDEYNFDPNEFGEETENSEEDVADSIF